MNEKVILLVEDNPDHELLTLRALQKNNITNKVLVAHDGQQAIDYVFGTLSSSGHATDPLPQMILPDLKLPKLDGFEGLRQLRADDRTRLLPVVILPTSNEEPDRFDGYDLGANSLLRKPVEFERFMEAVRQLGMYWLLLNEPAPPRRRS